MDRAEVRAEPEDVGDQALMRGLDTALAGSVPLAPEFATGATRHFVRSLPYGHPNRAMAVNPECRVQDHRPRASCTAARYVENAVSGRYLRAPLCA